MLLDIVVDLIKKEFTREEPIWKEVELSAKDMTFLQEECKSPSEFDPLNKRKKLIDNMVKGHARMQTMTCPYGQVCAIFDHGQQMKEMPWGLWGRILRMYSEKGKKAFKVFFLANTHLRLFPPIHEPITPIHINGGYTYPCNRETILIYRAEDATRVLLHELMHSCCLDNHKNGVDLVEAETEAWAELLYVGFLSQGDSTNFHTLLQKQSNWIQLQNQEVKKHMRAPTMMSIEFPWRYTIGKEEVWRRWNIIQQDSQHRTKIKSLRLTAPATNIVKDQFNVTHSSTIL